MGHAVERGAKYAVEYLFQYAHSQQLDMESFLYNADMDGSSLLHMAVDSGALKLVELCLQNGSRVRYPKASDKSTAFHLACGQGSLETVKLLSSHDLTICRITLIDSGGQTPLHRAAANGHVTVVEYLLDQGASVDPPDRSRCTPLFKAAFRGRVDTVQLLLERGADVTLKSVEQRSVLHAAVLSDVGVMELLLKVPSSAYLITDKDDKSFTPVHYAAKNGQSKNISLLMATNKAAAGVASNDLDTPLHIAAKYGWLPIVESLLVGRNIRMINLQNNKGNTPLHLACFNGHDQVAEYLLSQGATIEKDQNQKTALHLAANQGSKRCVMSILAKHPDCVNALEENKNTALNLASFHGHDEIVKYLLSLKNQEILMNAFNQNVLDIALNEEKKDVAMVIAEHVRWREVMSSSAPGALLMMQELVIKMPDVAERILDQCVTEEGDEMKPEYKVTKDLTIIQAKYVPNPERDQLTVLKTMTKYRRDNCLKHKVVFALMHLKWKKFGFTSLMFNLMLYLMYLLPLTALALYSRDNEKEFCAPNDTVTRSDYLDNLPTTRSNTAIQVLTYVVLVFTLIHLLREVTQIVKKREKYFSAFSNYFELACYITAMLYIFPSYDCKTGGQLQIGAMSMFFGWMNLILYLRKLSFYGSYVIMLATMFITLFKVLVLFLLFILSFGTTFYMLIDENELYISLPHWLLTIFVMTLGELNYADNFMPWEFPFSALVNVLFVIFVLAMPIILMNMLVGLAVGDIDNIQRNATMDRYVMQIEMLLETEQQLPQWLRRHVQFEKHVEYPNKTASLKTRLYDAICGFGHPGGDDSEEVDQDVSPEVVEIKTTLEEQEVKINQICNMLRKQSEMLETISQNSKREKGESSEKKKFSLKF
ncbi:Transient receptor putative cation channel sub A member 1 [Desmophyllum pertusum]|uniref:Transient receptor putative cation channel sub A member 1 n=1 Tax=Desmophyllum pertusum TaxID=174260 RepID=A0A9X0D654_9CNID|nr:Transient receptor putative cation channel sub A member 1 [Desmophyllum pertusum]